MKVTVIIPYKKDRGWLNQAIKSVPDNVQLILSQGEGNWPQNFNKALNQATGDYIKFLHEDDFLAPLGIEHSVAAFNEGADFIHGCVIELHEHANNKQIIWKPQIISPNLHSLLRKNTIHSASLMYKREIFERLGGFNEDPKMYSFEEFEFNLRCLKAGFKIGYCDKVIAFYRRHPNQIIRTVDIQSRKKHRSELVNKYLKNE